MALQSNVYASELVVICEVPVKAPHDRVGCL